MNTVWHHKVQTHMNARTIVSLFLSLLAASTISLAGASELIRATGTGVSLAPPPGFTVAQRFPGFQNEEQQASIMVSVVPAPAAELKKALTKEGLATKGINLLSSETAQVGGREGLMARVTQEAGGVTYHKWMLVAGDKTQSVMIVGTYPEDVAEQLDAPIKAAILTAVWDSPTVKDHFDGLSFRIEPSARLKLAGRVGNMLMLTESGGTGPLGPEDALYMVGTSFSPTSIADLRAFSESRAKLIEQVQDLTVDAGQELRMGGLDAYELQANGKDTKTGTPVRLYQVIAPDEGGYVIVVGLVGAKRAIELLPEFRKVTASFTKAAATKAP